jgi:hypothetical protein
MNEGGAFGLRWQGLLPKLYELVKRHEGDGTVKRPRCKARESLGTRRTCEYVAVTKYEAQHRRWTFYEAVKLGENSIGIG